MLALEQKKEEQNKSQAVIHVSVTSEPPQTPLDIPDDIEYVNSSSRSLPPGLLPYQGRNVLHNPGSLPYQGRNVLHNPILLVHPAWFRLPTPKLCLSADISLSSLSKYCLPRPSPICSLALSKALILSCIAYNSQQILQVGLANDSFVRVEATGINDVPGITLSQYCSKGRIDSSGGTIIGEGIKLVIPDRAIEDGQSIELSVQGCIDCPFELPDGVTLASPIFQVSPHCTFLRDVTVLMEYFLHIQSDEECKDLVFLTCTSKPGFQSRCTFQITESDLYCLRQNHYVQVSVRHLCKIALGTVNRGKSSYIRKGMAGSHDHKTVNA